MQAGLYLPTSASPSAARAESCPSPYAWELSPHGVSDSLQEARRHSPPQKPQPTPTFKVCLRLSSTTQSHYGTRRSLHSPRTAVRCHVTAGSLSKKLNLPAAVHSVFHPSWAAGFFGQRCASAQAQPHHRVTDSNLNWYKKCWIALREIPH